MTTTTQDAALRRTVQEQMERWGVPGMTVAIYQNDEVREHAFGVVSLDTKQLVTEDTLFQIGSISKVFTATLAMRLVEAGKLDLDTPVIEYLSDLKLSDKDAQQSITMRHLLSHSTGLYGDWFDDFGIGDDALSNAMKKIHTLPQVSKPGEIWSYCNSGFYIAGALIERITGLTFEEAMKQEVFEPLQMDRSFFFAHEAIVYPVSVGHAAKPGEDHSVARRYPLPRNVNPAGGIISTVGDLLKFARFHMGDGTVEGTYVLSRDSLNQMQVPQIKAAALADYYAIGWAIRSRAGATLVSHGGSTNGFQAYLTLVPEQNFALAQLTNSSRGRAAYEQVEAWALEHYCGLPKPDAQRITLPESKLAKLTGRYRQPLADITIDRHDDGLKVDITAIGGLSDSKESVQLPTMYIRPISETDFIIEGGEHDGTPVDFILNEDESPRYFRYHGRLSEPVPEK